MKIEEIKNLPKVLPYLQYLKYKPRRQKIVSAAKPLFEHEVRPIPAEIKAILASIKKQARKPRIKRQKGIWPPPNALFRPKVKGETQNEAKFN